MNRVASCIKLVQILSANNNYVSTKELAEAKLKELRGEENEM